MVITKKSPLSILIQLRVINLACLKQRFHDCLFQVSFDLYNFFILFYFFLIVFLFTCTNFYLYNILYTYRRHRK